jgi:DNA-binding transcriptional LysR family regulator
MGIVMASGVTVQAHLESGRLELLGLPVAKRHGNYHLAANAPQFRDRSVATTWRWLKEEAARTQSLFDVRAH